MPLPALLSLAQAPGEEAGLVHFERRQLTTAFFAEGAAFGDLDGDGHADVVSGPYAYAGPDFAERWELYEPKEFDPLGYSDFFFAWTRDLDGDRDLDVLAVGFPGQAAFWLENPGASRARFARHAVLAQVDNESPAYANLVGGAEPELVAMQAGRFGYAAQDPKNARAPWTFTPISAPGIGEAGPFVHGLGVGDVDGDGRADVLHRGGYFRQPAGGPGGDWPHTPVDFALGGHGGAQMLVYDVDGDGDADVVTSLSAHGYGLAWFEQTAAGAFAPHVVMDDDPRTSPRGVSISELHALALADVDGDGLSDVVTGKRFWSHGPSGSPRAGDPAELVWFRLTRRAGEGGPAVELVPHAIDHDSGVGTQVQAGDLDGDGRTDVLVGNKKGLFVFLQRPAEPSEPPLPPPDAPRHAGLSPAAALAAMSLPPGFRATLVAAEPDLAQPIAFAIDPKGRIFVAQAFAYPRKAPAGQGRDRILVLEDRDQDTLFETHTVFAEGLNLVSGIEVGFGGVFVGQAPELLFLPDRDGDLVPDGPAEVLLDGFGLEDTHETLNSFVFGPDGWLYGCHGVFTHSLVGRPGTPPAERKALNAGVWRYHPLRREFEVFAHGTSNPWGLDFDARGQAFITACVIPHLYHVIQGGRYQRQSGSHFEPYVYSELATVADHLHYLGATPWAGNGFSSAAGGGHAHCGALIYQADAFPEDWRGRIYMGNIHGNRLNTDVLEPRGASFAGQHAEDFLCANDAWFRAVHLKTGPDGALYLLDWYDEEACHQSDPLVWNRTNGRMYRISYGAPRPFDVDLDALDDVALVGLQMHANEWFARRARVLLQERGAGARALESLRALLLRHPEERVRLRALWTLYAVGGLDAASMRAAQRDPSPALRAWCLQLGLERPGALAGFEHLPAAADPDPLVRLYAAAGLQRLPLEERWELASRLAAHGEDAGEPNLPHVLWYGAAELVEADPERALLLARACAIPLFAEHTARRAAELKDGLEPCVRAIGDETEPTRRAALFTGLERALAGMRDAAAPPSWPRVRAELEQDPALAPRLAAIALAFGEVNDAGALARTLADPDAPRAEREQALAALLRVADPGLAPLCHELLQDAGLAGPALRALAALGDAATPARVLAAWGGLDAGLRRDAASALAGRAAWADELLSALERGELARSELSASAVRSIQSHGDPELDRRAAALFGTLRSTPAEKATRIAELKAEFPAEVLAAADLPRGRALFAETCAKCHRLFGSGGDIGPDLTGSNRADLGYLLHNLVDPSAEVGRDYLATVAWLSDGRVVSGLLRSQTPSAVTLCTESETLVLSRGEIEELVASELSTMPEGLLDGLDKHARRDLFAYLGSPSQVPRRLQPGEERELFDGATLAGWIGDPALWSVEGGEIVGRSAGLAENAFLRSEALLADFRLTLAVRLAGDAGNGGIQFRSRELAGGDVAGYQADIGPGYWATLYEEHGRGPLAQAAVPPPLRPGDWNTYSITAVGTRIRLELNGTRTVDLDDSQAAHAAREGILALQLHAGGPTEIRFRDLRLELDPKLED